MRFSILSLVTLIAIFSFVSAESYFNGNTNSLVRREGEEEAEATSTYTGGRGGAVSSTAEMAASTEASKENSEAATTTESGKGGKGGHGGSTEATETTATQSGKGGKGESSAESSTAAAEQKKKNKAAGRGNFNNPSILSGGTLFYIMVGVTCLLWGTGKAIDVQTERQERYAQRVAHSI